MKIITNIFATATLLLAIILSVGCEDSSKGAKILKTDSTNRIEQELTVQSDSFCANPSEINLHCASVFSVVMDEQSTLHFAFEQNSEIFYTYATEPYSSFAPPIAVTDSPEPIYNSAENRPKIVIDKAGGIYISWTKKLSARFSGDIRFSYARNVQNEDPEFSAPVTVNDDSLITGHRFDTLGISPEQDVYIAWIDKRDQHAAKLKGQNYKGAALYYSVLESGSKALSENRKIVDHACECCRLAMQTTRHARFPMTLMWRHIFPQDMRDHAIGRIGKEPTSDARYLEPYRATNDQWELQGCPHHGPQLTGSADSTEVDMVWFSNGKRNQGVHYARWDWNRKKVINESAIDESPNAGHPDIQRFQDKLYIAYQTKREQGNKSQSLIKLAVSDAPEATWSEPQLVIESSSDLDYPQLVANKHSLLLITKTARKLIIKELRQIEIAKAIKPLSKKVEDFWTASSEPLLVFFWASDCPPCFEDFSLIGKLTSQYGDKANFAFVATDGDRETTELYEIIQEFGLSEYDHYILNTTLDSFRPRFDPSWFGELPRHYRYEAGQRSAHSGRLGESLTAWFK